MKKILLALLTCQIALLVNAQIPYFAGTPGNDVLYSYTSLKIRPGANIQETYTTFQYGIGSKFASGLDLYTGSGSAYMGFLVRGGHKVNQHFGIGAQLTPSFDLNNHLKFSYLTGGLYLNGSITNDGKFFWCINDWFGIDRNKTTTINQWTYLGYSFSLKNSDAITPMIGLIHDWKFENEVDLAAGLYYTHKVWNFYIWGNDYFKSNPRIVLGVDISLPNKAIND